MHIPVAIQEAIIHAGERMHARGWVPATAGNISARLAPDRIAITRSGIHKGYMDAFSAMVVDLDGTPVTPGQPSAETTLHCQIFRRFPAVGAVLHGHSVAGTVLSMTENGPAIRLAGYELLKALGAETHDAALDLPLVDNDQDMPRLAALLDPLLQPDTPAYLIRGHGIYVWGRDLDHARHRLEAVEFMLECELGKR